MKFVPFTSLLEESDIVSIHCPLNPQSDGLFSDETFASMKEGAFLINTARGPIVDEQALANALQSGKLCGAALDVLETEPMSEDCPLLGVPNCIITPHVAWAPTESRLRLMDCAVENLRGFLSGEPLNIVN